LDIIVSHRLTDLDGLGAMVAARKLYPGAQPVLSERLHRLTRDFLVLYKDEIDIYYREEVDLSDIERVIIVDTHQREMLGSIDDMINWSDCETIIYDHHSHQELEWVDYDYSEEVGSATTILINRIIAEGLSLNPYEATVCALAIYADTGNLTYINTTPADARALAYLLESGANLRIINDFIKEPLNDEQQQLLEELIDNREELQIDGVNVVLFSISYDKYIVGINRVAEQLKRFYHLPSLFVLVYMKKKAVIIGRSSDEAVDIGRICSQLGGGGHAGAGAATLRMKLDRARETLIDQIKRVVRPLARIRSIMSSPVRTVTPDTSIEEVEGILKKYGHNGVVVCQDDQIKGIFSRRDLNKVAGHGLLHAPVKAYMTRDVITISAEAPIQKARELMVKNGIGRIPVTEGGKLVGIITRSNLLASYYGSETPYQHKNRYGSSLVEIREEKSDISLLVNSVLDKKCRDILKQIGEIASEKGSSIYLIGGAVRDLILKRDNKDLDFVIEGGNFDEFLSSVSERFQEDYNFNEHFRTGTIGLCSAYTLDFAEARKEKYFSAGALPEVEATNIFQDLFRRDYTVNCLALNISPDNRGELIDFFRGYEDVKQGLLRALHRFSFLDDPTRVIRGIRLACQLGFSFEKETRELIEEAVSMGDFSHLAPVRVLKELRLLLEERVTADLLELFAQIPVFRLLNLDIRITPELKGEFRELEDYLDGAPITEDGDFSLSQLKTQSAGEEWVLRLALFLEENPRENIINWGIKEKYRDILFTYSNNRQLYLKLNKEMGAEELVETLHYLSADEVLVLLIKAKNQQVRNNLKKYLQLYNLDIEINGNDLLDMGLTPGPIIKEILNNVYRAKLRGEVVSREEELRYARSIINNNSDNE